MDGITTAKDFYSVQTCSKAKNQDALESAVRKFRMALNSQTESVQERAMALACKEELKAFA